MKKTNLKNIKTTLEKELGDVTLELQSIGQINPSNPKDWEAVPDKMDILPADPNEVADKIESYEENTSILKQLEIRLNEIKNALVRIKDGKFGICSVCGKKIEATRLEADPAATTCLAHKDNA